MLRTSYHTTPTSRLRIIMELLPYLMKYRYCLIRRNNNGSCRALGKLLGPEYGIYQCPSQCPIQSHRSIQKAAHVFWRRWPRTLRVNHLPRSQAHYGLSSQVPLMSTKVHCHDPWFVMHSSICALHCVACFWLD